MTGKWEEYPGRDQELFLWTDGEKLPSVNQAVDFHQTQICHAFTLGLPVSRAVMDFCSGKSPSLCDCHQPGLAFSPPPLTHQSHSAVPFHASSQGMCCSSGMPFSSIPYSVKVQL